MSTHPVAVRRRLGRRRNTLIVVALFILVLLLVVWRAVAVLADPPSHLPESVATESASVLSFTSPDKTLTCKLDKDAATCSVTKPTWPGAQCGAQSWGVQVDTSSDGHLACLPKPLPAATTPLAYGDDVTRGDLTCESRQAAMRCLNNKTQHGYSVSQSALISY